MWFLARRTINLSWIFYSNRFYVDQIILTIVMPFYLKSRLKISSFYFFMKIVPKKTIDQKYQENCIFFWCVISIWSGLNKLNLNCDNLWGDTSFPKWLNFKSFWGRNFFFPEFSSVYCLYFQRIINCPRFIFLLII